MVFARGYGVRTVGTHDAVDTHTLFALGSTTKAFTALAAALMVDAGSSGGTIRSRPRPRVRAPRPLRDA